MIELLIIPIFAALNRVRGGGFYGDLLPSRSLFWVAPIITLFAMMMLPWLDALIFGAGYFIWAVFEWGRWFDLNNMPELERAKKPLERIIDSMSFGDDYIAMTIRMAFATPFLAYLSITAGLLFPFIATALYAVGWRFWRKDPNPKNEVMVGALWGVVLLSIA
jgi:hypothetical protein